ncbi:MAG TPA: hypothetical protein VIM94_12110 [Salegentibacter sp.]|uniref:hypothetical protein n=1 Tax=Salegentibacter sp. TaxID=1903072 RepID=UPI002F94A609
MKIINLLLFLTLSLNWVNAQNLKPYVLAIETTDNISELKDKLPLNLEQNGIEIVGQYQPANDANRWILIFTSPELKSAVKEVGQLTGFAASLRVAITRENGKTLVSYTNPAYWGNAYFRKDYPKVSAYYTKLSNKLESAMEATGSFRNLPFGSEEGLSEKELRKYHYMFAMPYFDDTVELESFDSYQTATNKIETAAKEKNINLEMLYKIEIPGKNIALYGFGIKGEKGEAKFLPIIDIGKPKHTAFLPYEVLVIGNEVHMLHGRYRIAIAFPDLTMGTFSKIMSTPGDIEDSLEKLVK